jgi:hypothetical protein
MSTYGCSDSELHSAEMPIHVSDFKVYRMIMIMIEVASSTSSTQAARPLLVIRLKPTTVVALRVTHKLPRLRPFHTVVC